ncbi:cytochrome P450 [Rhizobium lentis]|uniref:cytochrome P450 n=1 Tax=Rhizobium lentis TaxID=1138194 RepID=UPI001C82ECDA|nr:cytochrome P450 [Rhizobium lentis]MBX4976159.1 cytochrome P450 [Rhizobium lentis]MBX5042588.1 cytochrome P450 [Rhizobium lentis]MBX5072422.1 cytochrome P450 [Rhizobium lentis]MBX5106425.1 cytochrome P450 [Rhizobium lentis]MBX5113248.1 cytochrome P450 [Rhizobium lentis]
MEKLTRTVPTISSAEIERDPHEAFKRYRAIHPIATLETGGTVVLRHADVSRLSRDKRLRATETAIPAHGGITQGALFDIFQHGMLTANGHDHERRRFAITRALASQVIDDFRSCVRNAAEVLIDGFHREGAVELGSGYAAKLPILALAGMLGVPDRDVPVFMRDVDQMNEFFRPNATAAAMAEAELAAQRVQDYLTTVLARKRAGQATDFLSHYLAVADADQRISGVEVIIQLVQLIIGGTESVRAALVAQTANLLSNRAQWEAVCEDPALASPAVSESLRFEPGIAGVVRISTDDIDVDGWTLPAGQMVILSSMSALRDERVFERPDSFDIFRSDLVPSHLAFGGGAHKCVAEALGRAELEEGLNILAKRLPNLTMKTQPIFMGHVFVRRATECWVTW